MDWTTGLWFEFNDENVSFLESGPNHTIVKGTSCWDKVIDCEATKSNIDKRTGKRVRTTGSNISATKKQTLGCSDAYSLFYVERSYFGQHAAKQIIQIGSNIRNDDLFTWIEKKRIHHEQLVTV